jgi:hypothetical protein
LNRNLEYHPQQSAISNKKCKHGRGVEIEMATLKLADGKLTSRAAERICTWHCSSFDSIERTA